MNLQERLTVIAEALKSNNKKVTVSNVITASLFSEGGTLAGYEDEINNFIDQTNDKRKYLCVWGDWEKGINAYDNEIKKVTHSYFTEEHGYSEHEVFELENLSKQGVWVSTLGNHIIVRLK